MIISGTLKNTVKIQFDEDTYSLKGQIYGDTKGRFQDGEWIYTSRVTEELPDDIFKTQTNFYKVEFQNG